MSDQLLPKERKLTSYEITEHDIFGYENRTRPDNVEPAPVRQSDRVGLQDSIEQYKF